MDIHNLAGSLLSEPLTSTERVKPVGLCTLYPVQWGGGRPDTLYLKLKVRRHGDAMQVVTFGKVPCRAAEPETKKKEVSVNCAAGWAVLEKGEVFEAQGRELSMDLTAEAIRLLSDTELF